MSDQHRGREDDAELQVSRRSGATCSMRAVANTSISSADGVSGTSPRRSVPCQAPNADARNFSVSASASSSTVFLGSCIPAKRFGFFLEQL